MADVNSTPRQGLELWDVIEATDKVTLHASFLKTHLGVIQSRLEGDVGPGEIKDARQLAYAADYFLQYIEEAAAGLLELARRKDKEAVQ